MSEPNAELSYSRVIVFAEGNVHGVIVKQPTSATKDYGRNTRSCSPTKATAGAYAWLPRLLGLFRVGEV